MHVHVTFPPSLSLSAIPIPIPSHSDFVLPNPVSPECRNFPSSMRDYSIVLSAVLLIVVVHACDIIHVTIMA